MAIDAHHMDPRDRMVDKPVRGRDFYVGGTVLPRSNSRCSSHQAPKTQDLEQNTQLKCEKKAIADMVRRNLDVKC